MLCVQVWTDCINVLEHLPPQQGLRHKLHMFTIYDGVVLEHLPPQQGLRRFLGKTLLPLEAGVLEHLPPQQGLRQSTSEVRYGFLSRVLEHLPPQQGLRPVVLYMTFELTLSTRTSSTTTRIKTLHQFS